MKEGIHRQILKKVVFLASRSWIISTILAWIIITFVNMGLLFSFYSVAMLRQLFGFYRLLLFRLIGSHKPLFRKFLCFVLLVLWDGQMRILNTQTTNILSILSDWNYLEKCMERKYISFIWNNPSTLSHKRWLFSTPRVLNYNCPLRKFYVIIFSKIHKQVSAYHISNMLFSI